MNAPTKTNAPATATSSSDKIARLLKQYGCGTIHFAGSENASFERHQVFDNVINPAAACDRERFEAMANSVRDVCSINGESNLEKCWRNALFLNWKIMTNLN